MNENLHSNKNGRSAQTIFYRVPILVQLVGVLLIFSTYSKVVHATKTIHTDNNLRHLEQYHKTPKIHQQLKQNLHFTDSTVPQKLNNVAISIDNKNENNSLKNEPRIGQKLNQLKPQKQFEKSKEHHLKEKNNVDNLSKKQARIDIKQENFKQMQKKQAEQSRHLKKIKTENEGTRDLVQVQNVGKVDSRDQVEVKKVREPQRVQIGVDEQKEHRDLFENVKETSSITLVQEEIDQTDNNIGEIPKDAPRARFFIFIIIALIVTTVLLSMGMCALWCRRQYKKHFIEERRLRENYDEMMAGYEANMKQNNENQQQIDQQQIVEVPAHNESSNIEAAVAGQEANTAYEALQTKNSEELQLQQQQQIPGRLETIYGDEDKKEEESFQEPLETPRNSLMPKRSQHNRQLSQQSPQLMDEETKMKLIETIQRSNLLHQQQDTGQNQAYPTEEDLATPAVSYKDRRLYQAMSEMQVSEFFSEAQLRSDRRQSENKDINSQSTMNKQY